jgi:N-methylhydantoinase A
VSLRIGIDVGGTFTDFIVIDDASAYDLLKVPTTLEDQSIGVMRGIEALAQRRGVSSEALLADTELVVHGTTTADNTLIEMNGALTGLITTAGHRDTIDIRRGFKESIWDPALLPPTPIAPRRRRRGVVERLDASGAVVTPLDEASVRDAVRRLAKQGVESIAVCLLFSFLNPAHERRVREIIAEEHPDARISLSSDVMPTAPEFERTSTTLVDAYVGPRVENYLLRLESALRSAGLAGDLLVMQSSGGIMQAAQVAKHAISVLGSGPAGGVEGACAEAAQAGIEKFIAVDMGGTSYEVGLIQAGRPEVTSFWNWQHRYLIGLPMVEIHSIGAGGGSIASVDDDALSVGPRSAGAHPGPICYGRGGMEPTVTDANLLLGYLNPDALCGGAFALDVTGVEAAIEQQIAKPLGLSTIDAAYGIYRIVNANMNDAIRRVSCDKGLDPRRFQMVVYGGNGPVHASKQAEEIGIERILVPKTSPAFSALGLLVADYSVDRQRSYLTPVLSADLDRLNGLKQDLETGAVAELRAAGLGDESLVIEHLFHMCYPGQNFDMPVRAPWIEGAVGPDDLARVAAAFHDLHERIHTYATREEEPLVRSIRVRVRALTAKPELAPAVRSKGEPKEAIVARRRAYFDGEFMSTPVYDGDQLGPGHVVEGPAVIEEKFTTIVLHPGHRAQLDARGGYAIAVDSKP